MTDWGQVAQQAADAAERVIGHAWGQAAGPAEEQIKQMSALAARVEVDYAAVPPRLSYDEYESLRDMQKDALAAILNGYEAIAILAVEQAVDAAWAVFETALQAAIRLP